MDFVQTAQQLIQHGVHHLYTVGITNDPNRRRGEHGNPSFWQHWVATTQDEAHQLEVWAIRAGFLGAGGGDRWNSVYIYLFRP